MPFTFSHPALVLPLKRYFTKWFSFTGLVMGSMLPDFEYFFRMKLDGEIAHSWAGILYFGLPAGILLCFIFHQYIRNSLYENLPIFLRERLCIYLDFNWKKYFSTHFWIVLFSIAIGDATHLIWDGFTHSDGYFVLHLNWLQYEMAIFNFSIPIYDFLQHLSTLLGFMVLIYVLISLPDYPNFINTKSPYTYRYYWFWTIVYAVIIYAIRVYFADDSFWYGDAIATGIAAFMLGLWMVSMQNLYRINSTKN